ncbi:MAG: hypothetical protein OXG79_05410 [Chloroflexi bacterium]|nr:hypothetical protein [Chloroflexota bacterium]MCY4111813.1 hypothetical protein [Chloroflexota bacterium]
MAMLRHIADVPLYAAIGVGPLVAGRTVIDGFIGIQGDPWLGRTSLTIEWLAFVVLGYFFTRTMVGLALDYEPFWRIPGRVSEFAALLAAETTPGPLHAHVERAGGDVSAALHARSLREAGIDGGPLGRLNYSYIAIRAGCLAAVVALVCLVVELVRRAASGDQDVLLIGILAAVAAMVVLVAAFASRIIGRGVAYYAARGIRKQAATASA